MSGRARASSPPCIPVCHALSLAGSCTLRDCSAFVGKVVITGNWKTSKDELAQKTERITNCALHCVVAVI